ncbi:GNAT family N-acetyltransferase [Shouchella patagoniensis]|uniref:GNAT family N-acetyltransferase n=1 Tax=Shouchella patagoniensis TaxID=228576 RepID=UPI0009952D11|nr:GNAT family N-acetyltransferase [Shouchella patagoniensis]
MIIRQATKNDVRGIAKVHVDSWRTTYKGLIAQSMLDSLKYEKREELWRKNLGREENILYVAEEDNGNIIGFADGSVRTKENRIGDLTSIYLLQECQGLGVGKELLERVFAELKKQDCQRIYVEVLERNKASTFYEACGGQLEERKRIKLAGDELGLLIYKWDFS